MTWRGATAELPIVEALPRIVASLDETPNLVLVAPPGAGKTTVVPLALLERIEGRIVLLEPRRLAARAAAIRMATLLGERVGETVGLRVRLETKVSRVTRIEVVTEGVFTRMVTDDPELSGVGAVLLDEFHERSLDADLALTLALDAQGALRPDVRLIAMSATLDGARVATMMDALVVESRGRSFPVEIEYRERRADERIEDAVARAAPETLQRGSTLVFLPGQGEIERTRERLADRSIEALPLYGALPPAEQDRALKPTGHPRIVLATSIAETSLTIPDIRTVIDSGLTRRPRFDPASGLSRLETVRASRAAADQRAGRAGRVGPGYALRLWREEQTASLEPFDRPEILAADLAPLALDLAAWGVSDPDQLRWLDAPPKPAWSEAVSLLRNLGALDANGLTTHGSRLAALPLPPRLAQMVALAADPVSAARAALLIQERGLAGRGADIAARVERLTADRSPRAKAVRGLADRIAKGLPRTGTESVGAAMARGLFDRIGQRAGRQNERQRFRLSGGGACEIEADDALATAPFLAVAEVTGRAGAARILTAAPLTRDEIEGVLGERIAVRRHATFDTQRGTVAEERRMLGALVLSRRAVEPDPDEALTALMDAIADDLPHDDATRALLDRLRFVHPDIDDRLAADPNDWLGPFVPGATKVSDVTPDALAQAMLATAGTDRGTLDRAAPPRLPLPTGRDATLTYAEDRVELHARPQELFGLDRHPRVPGRPVTLVLLSPAGRPIQTTTDLPAFWRGSWADVRADMRGRYPKHPWPEDPTTAAPTTRTKRRA